MEDARKLSDFIDLDLLQNIQDNCSKAMGLAFITVDYKGIPITKYSGFTSHCMLGRQAKGFAEMCEQCDAHGGLHAAITGQPYIYRCHADLVDFAVPLIVNGSYMGAVLGGQVRLQEESERELEHILPQRPNWKRDKEWEEAYQKLEVVTYEKVGASVKLLRDIIVTFVERRTGKGADGVLREKEKQLSEERAARLDLEKQVQKQESNTARRRTELHYFFFVMNIISKLAYEEKAAKTEAVSYDFADMMRYAAGAEQKISTLGEELNYIGALLRIRKAWVRDKLAYTISVPEQYHQVSCPFMVLQPIVECALEGAETEAAEPRKLDFYAEEENGRLLFQILSNDTSRSVEELTEELSGAAEEGYFHTGGVDRLLKQTLGGGYRLMVNRRRDGRAGAAVSFYLPLERNG